MKLFTDPVVIVLLILAAGLWILRDTRKEPVKKWGWRILLSGFILFYLLSIYSFVTLMGHVLEKDYLLHDTTKIPRIDVIVVLGGGSIKMGLQSRAAPSQEAASRLLYGLQMLEQSGAEHIVFTGGGTRYRDAEVMADAALRLGVDKSRIIVEPNSRNTWEHPIELTKVLKDREMTLGIVTAASHMKRSLMVFKKYYPNIVPLPSSYIYKPGQLSAYAFLPNTRNLNYSSAIFHEIFGLIWYSMKGYIEK